MTTDQENAKERQEERWTAEEWGDGASTISYRVTNKDGDFIAYVDVPPGAEGRRTLARMVAALRMERTLVAVAAVFEAHGLDHSGVGAQVLAALEAAKRLQP